MKINKKVMEGAAVVVFVMTITVTSVTANQTEPKSEPYTQEILLEDTAQATKEKARIDVVALAVAAEEKQAVDSAEEQSKTAPAENTEKAQANDAGEKEAKSAGNKKEETTTDEAPVEDLQGAKPVEESADQEQQEASDDPAETNPGEALQEEKGEAPEEKIDVAQEPADEAEKAEESPDEDQAEVGEAADEKKAAEELKAEAEKEEPKESADEAETTQETELNGKSQQAETENGAKEEDAAKEAAADNAGSEDAEDTSAEEGESQPEASADEAKNEDVKDTEAEAEESQPEEPASEWATKLMPNVEEYLNIRAEANEEAELLGKLRRGDAAEILERGEEWSKISSGSVEGYVKNEFCVFDEAAETMAYELGTVYATASTGGLRVRAEANAAEETGIVHVMEEGEKIKVDTAAETPEGWVAVKHEDSGTTAYVSAEFVSVELKLGKAISVEEEQEAIRRAEEEAAAKERERQAAQSSQSSQSSGGGTTQRSAVSASYDDVTLLGALIQCEAGGECYEGQVAVGAVVMNRLRQGYAGSISGVIYQSGQFAPASSGALARVLASGVSGSCLSAAQEAINGVDNVGGATSFRGASSGQSGIVIGNHVFY